MPCDDCRALKAEVETLKQRVANDSLAIERLEGKWCDEVVDACPHDEKTWVCCSDCHATAVKKTAVLKAENERLAGLLREAGSRLDFGRDQSIIERIGAALAPQDAPAPAESCRCACHTDLIEGGMTHTKPCCDPPAPAKEGK